MFTEILILKKGDWGFTTMKQLSSIRAKYVFLLIATHGSSS